MQDKSGQLIEDLSILMPDTLSIIPTFPTLLIY
jgi:hypothetical protein